MSQTAVLLVDDEHDFVTVLAERLETRGLKVDTVENGEAAIERVEGHGYDAILLDMAMPGMDGIETLKKLLAINSSLQVVLLTGQSTLQQAVEAMKLGALDFLEKPANIDTLVTKIYDAARRTTRLRDKRIEQSISDIVRKKGW